MGFSIIYSELFSIQVEHHFYNSKVAPELSLRPTGATQSTMKSAKMLYRSAPNGGQVFYQEDGLTSGTPQVDMSPEFTAVFCLFSADKSKFLKITGLAADYVGGQRLIFTNDGSTALSSVFVDPESGALLTHTFSLTGTDPTFLHIKGPNVQWRFPRPPADANGDFKLDLNPAGWPSGTYTKWETDDGGGNTAPTTFFVDHEAQNPNRVAFIEITYPFGGGSLYGTKEEFTIKLDARPVYWRYYIFNRSGTAQPPLQINGSETFNAVSPTAPVNADAEFQSAGKILFSETPISGLKLEDADGTLIANLPNPSFNQPIKAIGTDTYESEIYIYI